MSKMILPLALLVIGVAFGCAKKDEGGGGGPVGCGPQSTLSLFHGRCIAQASCPTGLVQNPDQQTMCQDSRTGENVSQMQCGTGFYLTTNGCYQRGPCPQGQALRGDVCVEVIANGGPPQQQGYGQQFQQSPFGQQPQMYNQGGVGFQGYNGGYNPYFR